MKLAFMLEDKKMFKVDATTEKFVRSWNSTTGRHEPDAELFNAMFDTDSMTLLTNVTEEWIDHLIDTQDLDDINLTHKYNADEEMRCLMAEAMAEFS